MTNAPTPPVRPPIAAATLVLAALIALAVGYQTQRLNLGQREARFEALAKRIADRVSERVRLYEYGLRGARGAIAAVGTKGITRERFRNYISTRDLPVEFPGANGFGYIRRVPAAEEESFLRAARADGRPNFKIRELAAHAGDRLVIEFIEPEAANEAAIGLDIASEPNRAEAALRAEIEDAAMLTAPITLVQRTGVKEGGVLLMLPVYAEHFAPAIAEARAGSAAGWVYAPLILPEVMSGFDFNDGAVTLAIDDVAANHQVRAFTSPQHEPPAVAGLLRVIDVPLFGRTWHYEIKARQRFLDSLNQTPPLEAAIATFAGELLVLALLFVHLQNRQSIRLAHEGRAELAAIVENSNDAIIGKRIDGSVTSWNRAAEDLFGYTREEALGRTLASLIIPEDMMEEEVRILGRLASGERIPHFETIRQRKDGRRIQVSVSVAPVRDDKGLIIGASKTARDISRQKDAENEIHILNATLEAQVEERTKALNEALEAARQASRSKADFLANMSHEIRTPMNAVLGLAYLAEQQAGEPGLRDLLRKITQAGRTLLGIINDILDFSKIEEGRLDLEETTFSLRNILENLSTIMTASAGDKTLELIISPPPPGINYLRGDALRLEQILVNLISNAIKFTEAGHVLASIHVVSADEAYVTLRFSIQDTGVGIATAKQAAIFAPFTQADTSTTRRFGGTGLGLAICRQLVNLMGGEIGVTSTEGHGSEFWFTARFAKSTGPETAQPELDELDVLVADDNELALDALKRTSEQLGWQTTAVTDGASVIDFTRSQHLPDVVVVDWQMPGMDGLQVARTIRQSQPEGQTPIIVMVTAHSREQLAASAEDGVADALLTKPVTASTLYDAVSSAMRQRGQLPAPRLEPQAATGNLLDGLRLLVVDDSDINRDLAKRIFSREGAQVTTADDGQEAVSLLEAAPRNYDLVLMDVQMPVMDGLEATSRIRQNEHCRALPVIALTAGAFTSQREAALSSGMNAVVTKPFDIERTIALIRELCGRTVPSVPPSAPVKDTVAAPPAATYPGIDLQRGLEIWGEESMYRQYLRRFARDYGNFVDGLAGRSDEEIGKLAHKLKGAAASLGLGPLASAAGHLESRCREGQASAAEQQALADTLATALQSIAGYAPEPAARPATQSIDLEGAVAEDLVPRLLRQLDCDNPDEVWPLLRQLEACLPADALSDFREHVERFAFRQAEDELRRVAHHYKIVFQET